MTLEQRISGIRKGQYDVEIINAVRERPELYDKANENHKNPSAKDLEWKRIGAKMKVPVGIVVKRWTVIRERFAAEKRKVLPLGASHWWLMEHMTWLDPHITPRQCKSKGYSMDYPFQGSRLQHGYMKQENDDRCPSPPPPIAFPEVLMDHSSPPNSSCNSIDGEQIMHNDRRRLERRETHASEESYSDWSSHPTLDVDEAAAARVLAVLRSIEDRSLRHQFRKRFHQLAEDCEAAAFSGWKTAPDYDDQPKLEY